MKYQGNILCGWQLWTNFVSFLIGHVSLVDWDISEFNYCAYDVATFFILPRYFAVCEGMLKNPAIW